MQQKTTIEKNIIFIMLIFSIIGLLLPTHLLWTKKLAFPMLALIAFCVGLTLTPTNFKDVWKNKKIIIRVLSFKYAFIPLITFIICMYFRLPTPFTIGLVTLACCPAANTGNILCYLAKGNTAMIVITTITGSLLAPLLTPTVIYLLLHKIVHIQYMDILLVIITGITIPMTFGILINYYFPKYILPIKPIIPSIGILAVSIIITTIISQHATQILSTSPSLFLVCTLIISLFLIFGFLFSKFINCDLKNSIAMAFEIGTFDGVLGILLAKQIAGDASTISVVIFAVLNLIIGSIASRFFTTNIFWNLQNET